MTNKYFKTNNFPPPNPGSTSAELKNLLRMMEDAGLMRNEALQRAVFSAGMANDLFVLKALQQLINAEWLRTQIDKNPFRPLPKSDEVAGDIHIGDVIETGAPFGLDLNKEILCHILIAGCSGSGKTNLNRHIIRQLAERGIPVFIPDIKNDYASIHTLIGKENLLTTKPDAGELKFNPLQPPEGVNPIQWLQVIVDIFGQAFSLMVGSKGFLLENINELYRTCGVYEGKKEYPSMFELYTLLEKTWIPLYSRDARFQESSLGRMKTALVTLGDVFDCSVGYPIPELIRTNWVLQLHGLASFIQNFLVLSIMYAFFMYRISNNLRSGKLRHVVILDEGKRVADKNQEKNKEIPYTDLLVSQIREFDTGIFLSDQEVTKIAESYKANTYTKIGFSLNNGSDIWNMARCMSLNREQMEYFNKLKVGQGIVRFGRYPSPFIIQVPFEPV